MTKRKVIRKSNRPFTYNPNYYSWGGDFIKSLNLKDTFNFKDTFSGSNVGNMLKGGISGAAGSAVGNVVGGAIGGGLKSGAGSAISNIGGAAGSLIGTVNPLLGGIVSAGSGILGGVTNALFGSKLNQEKINKIEGSNKGMNTLMVDNSSADTIEDQWLNQDFGSNFSKSDIGKDGLFSNKAKNKYKSLKEQQGIARNRALTAFENAADAADIATDLNAAANFAAYGGPLSMWGDYGSGAIDYELAKEDLGIKAINALSKNKITALPNSFNSPELNTFADGGKIHIKKANRGKFTKYCGGKVTSECIARGKRSSDPAVRKRATFAANSRKWHDEGGPLDTAKQDNTRVYTPEYFEPIERTFSDGRKYSDLTPEEQINVSLGRDISGRPLEEGLEIVSPEFDALSLYRSLATLPKGFLKGNGEIPIKADKYYRQVARKTKGIEDALSTKTISAKSDLKEVTKTINGKTVTFGKKNFDVPFFKKGDLWYGKNPRMDVIVGREAPELEWMPITKSGRFRPDAVGIEDAYIRTTPLVNGEPNLAPTGLFEYYRHYPVIGMRNVTNGFPHLPIIGVNTLSETVNNKKAFGGDLLTHGAEWDNGVTVIGNGDTHENNPYEGVQMGVDNQGIPNLVEEGEVVFNDYVFSNRLIVPNTVRAKYKLRGNRELTFADAAKQMQKESEERPNDPISKRGLESAMLRLQQAQETVREEKQASQEGVQYAHGGRLGTLFDGLGTRPNLLDGADYRKRQGYGTLSEHINAEDLWNKYKAGADGSSEGDTNKGFDLTQLRYAPVVGAAIGLGQNLFSRPDYSSANAILEAANQAGNYTPVGYTPIGNYLQYRPFDRNFYLNKLNAQAGATRRAIMNTTSPSRNAALLAADYNAQGKLGDLARQAEEYNLAQRQAVEQFNRATNQANAEMGLKAAMANQEAALKARSSRLSGVAQAMAVRDAIDERRSASRSANFSNLFESLGNIGVDEMNKADQDFYIKYVMGANLPLEEYRRRYGLDAARKEAKKRGFTDNEITKLFLKNGGKLKKRRGGLTY